VLDRKYFNSKSRKHYRCPCDICSRAKISFSAVRDRLAGLIPGTYMSADVLIMQNIPSREGYRYVLLLWIMLQNCAGCFQSRLVMLPPSWCLYRNLSEKFSHPTTFSSGIFTLTAGPNLLLPTHYFTFSQGHSSDELRHREMGTFSEGEGAVYASAFLSPCCILVVSCGVCSISSKSDSNKDRAGPYESFRMCFWYCS
jgi:hypothetical protein